MASTAISRWLFGWPLLLAAILVSVLPASGEPYNRSTVEFLWSSSRLEAIPVIHHPGLGHVTRVNIRKSNLIAKRLEFFRLEEKDHCDQAGLCITLIVDVIERRTLDAIRATEDIQYWGEKFGGKDYIVFSLKTTPCGTVRYVMHQTNFSVLGAGQHFASPHSGGAPSRAPCSILKRK